MRTTKEATIKKINLIVTLIKAGCDTAEINRSLESILGIKPSHDYVRSVGRAYKNTGMNSDPNVILCEMAKVKTKKTDGIIEEAKEPNTASLFSALEAANLAEKTINELGLTVGDSLFLAFLVDLRITINNFFDKYLTQK